MQGKYYTVLKNFARQSCFEKALESNFWIEDKLPLNSLPFYGECRGSSVAEMIIIQPNM